MKQPHLPPSSEELLIEMTPPRHRDDLNHVLHTLSAAARQEFSTAFLDYLQTGHVDPPRDVIIGGIYLYLTQRIHPLHYSSTL